jgi:hypothetical protein
VTPDAVVWLDGGVWVIVAVVWTGALRAGRTPPDHRPQHRAPTRQGEWWERS